MNSKLSSEKFDEAIEKFLMQIESLWTSLPTVLKTIERSEQSSNENYNNFLYSHCAFNEVDETYQIKIENARKNRVLRKEAESYTIAYVIIKRNFLVSLVSQFDTYIGMMMKCIFLVRPDLIDSSEKPLTYTQLKTFNNLDDAKDYIIEKEIETNLRDSHTEQFRWFEKKLSINLLKDLPIWSEFIEITQRRNLFVHTDGKVTTQYLNNCKENNVKLSDDLKVGDELEADLQYFEKAFVCLFEIRLKLNQVIRRNLLKDQIEDADKSFLNISFELIQNGQYELAKEIYDFADKYIKKFSNNDLHYRIILNRAQIYKWLDKNEKCIEIINSVDWSATGDLFKLSSSVLKDEFEKSFDLMRKIGNNESTLHPASFRDWPIFKQFIQNKDFKDIFKEIYNKDFEITETEKSNVA